MDSSLSSWVAEHLGRTRQSPRRVASVTRAPPAFKRAVARFLSWRDHVSEIMDAPVTPRRAAFATLLMASVFGAGSIGRHLPLEQNPRLELPVPRSSPQPVPSREKRVERMLAMLQPLRLARRKGRFIRVSHAESVIRIDPDKVERRPLQGREFASIRAQIASDRRFSPHAVHVVGREKPFLSPSVRMPQKRLRG